MEWSLGGIELARSIFDIAIKQPLPDMPELLLKVYVAFEICQGEYRRARSFMRCFLTRHRTCKFG